MTLQPVFENKKRKELDVLSLSEEIKSGEFVRLDEYEDVERKDANGRNTVRKPLDDQAKLFLHLITAQRLGRGVLTFFLGLQPLEFIFLTKRYASTSEIANKAMHLKTPSEMSAWKRGALRQELLELRRDEWFDLRDLLLKHAAGKHMLEPVMASIVASACLGGDHLWRDLGLTSRDALGDLLQLFFPDLAVKNTKDMKWKKFFYKQLCEQEGGYVCRAPSCEECAAYDDCFGAEI